MQKDSHFTTDDFYSIYTILERKSECGLFGQYSQLYPVSIRAPTWQQDRCDRKYEIVFDTSGWDIYKLCISFVFWTADLHKHPAYKDIVRFLADPLIASKYAQVSNNPIQYLCSRREVEFKAILMFALKNVPRDSLWHFHLTSTLIYHFGGGAKYGHRDGVFDSGRAGTKVITLSTTHCSFVDGALKMYCQALDGVFDRVDCIPSHIAMEEAKVRNNIEQAANLIFFLRTYLHFTGEEIRTIARQFTWSYNTGPGLDNFVRSGFNVPSEYYPRIAEFIQKEQPRESCGHCYIRNKTGITCKFHPVVVPSATTLPMPAIMGEAASTGAYPDSVARNPLHCIICMEKKIDTRIDPCGHAFCGKCLVPIKECPYCRGPIVKKDPLFIV